MMIKIVGLGPGSKESITVGTLDALKSSSKVLLRTKIHPTIKYIDEMGIEYETYDDRYETLDNFDEVYKSIAEDVVKRHEEFGDLVYAVPGHPLVAEKSVNNLISLCKEKNIGYKILTAVSFVDVMMEVLEIDPIEGLKIIDAFDVKNQVIDRRVGTIITQVYNKIITSEVKIYLSQFYNDEKEIYFVRAAGVEGEEIIRKIKLYELDRQEEIDYLTSVYVPKDYNDEYKDFYDLVSIIEKLRSEDGCPWDRDQTHESIKGELLEEAYEVVDAINNKDDSNLVEELGDVLLHVIFHSIIGKEEGYFNENDIVKGICDKMIYRHPHVFGDISCENSKEVLQNWDEIKKVEKGITYQSEAMKNIANALPMLIKAHKVQEKAAKVGFDWDSVEPAMDKVLEELQEIKDVYKTKDQSKILEEVGDLFFSVVNVSRILDINPEFALKYTVDKFIRRFEFMEQLCVERNFVFKDLPIDKLDELWEEAKKAENTKGIG